MDQGGGLCGHMVGYHRDGGLFQLLRTDPGCFRTPDAPRPGPSRIRRISEIVTAGTKTIASICVSLPTQIGLDGRLSLGRVKEKAPRGRGPLPQFVGCLFAQLFQSQLIFGILKGLFLSLRRKKSEARQESYLVSVYLCRICVTVIAARLHDAHNLLS